MTSMIAATAFLLAFFVLPGPISRLMGAKFAAMFLATSGVLVLPIIFGSNWSAALVAALDVALLLVGARLASRFGFVREIRVIWIKRIAAAISAILFVAFGAMALIVAGLANRATDALPYDFLALVSAIVFVALLARRQEQVFTRSFAGSLVSASPQA